jgi:hypothetical protein
MTEFTKGAARERIDAAELKLYAESGTIITDDRRRRPLWFDGRFLDAQALNSEQNYFLSRQADIARVAGLGVIHGLMVDQDETASRTISISAGHGITPSGELVILPEELTVNLTNIPEIQRLDARFGLSEIPRQPPRNRSGLFIIALRPVEYTSDPIASYPTSINGTRSVEDGNIIEATAVTLIPYPDHGARSELSRRRKHVSREIFIEGSKKGQPAGVLPLAMIALNLGVIEWIDPHMVRREVGARDHEMFGLGIAPRSLQEAYVRQYYDHYREIVSQKQNGSVRFMASEHFTALPAAGPMPAATINVDNFTQSYFPPEMDVDLSIVPEDEIPAMLEDSFSLPPLDLSLSGDHLESTSVLVVIPVPRGEVRRLSLSLKSMTRRLRAITPGIVSKRTPMAALTSLGLKRPNFFMPLPVESDESVWRQTLKGRGTLWYIRRRNVHYKADVISSSVVISTSEAAIEKNVVNKLKELKLGSRFTNLKKRGTTASEAEMMSLFSSPVLLKGSATTIKAVIAEVEGLDTVDRKSVAEVTERYTESEFGEGIALLESKDEALTTDKRVTESIAGSGAVPELDRLAKKMTDAELKEFSKELIIVAKSGDGPQKDNVRKLVEDRLMDMKTRPRVRGGVR